jgi:DNA repair protein RecN (Recombination protein N)
VTGIHRLDYPGRVEELARLLAGAEITETTRRSARELIDSGAEYKKRRTMQ